MPFQIAMRGSEPKAFMTSYNKLNGLHCSENKRLLQGILRDECGFKGLVMSDWYADYRDVVEQNNNFCSGSVRALSQELSILVSISRCRAPGDLIKYAAGGRKITNHTLDERVRNVLNFVNKAIATGIPENAAEGTKDTKETSQLLRQISAESTVLLKN